VGIAAWREPPRELQKRNLGIAYIDVGMQRHTSSFIIQGYCELSYENWLGLFGKKEKGQRPVAAIHHD